MPEAAPAGARKMVGFPTGRGFMMNSSGRAGVRLESLQAARLLNLNPQRDQAPLLLVEKN